MQVTNRVFAAATFLVVSALSPGLSLAADAGRVSNALGEANVLRGTSQLQVTTGAAIQSGDEIRTGYPAQVMVDMADGSKLALPHGTNFKVDEFAQNSSGGSAIFSLLKGAFRTVSGLIGKGSSDDYQMNTPVATMGIRGTDYSAVMKVDGGKRHPNGLYAAVHKGRIFIKNAGGVAEFSVGQFAYVRDINTKAELVKGVLDVFEAAGLRTTGSFTTTFANFNFELDRDPNSLKLQFNPTIKTPEVPASPS